jgi:hypothetical protein
VRVTAFEAGDFTPEHWARYCTVVVLPAVPVGKVTFTLVWLAGTGFAGTYVTDPGDTATV